MARWLFVSLLGICLICSIQAFPQSGNGPAGASTTPSTIETAVSDVMESLQKGIKNIMEDPGLNKLVQDGQHLLQNVATSIQTEAAKIIPKTK